MSSIRSGVGGRGEIIESSLCSASVRMAERSAANRVLAGPWFIGVLDQGRPASIRSTPVMGEVAPAAVEPPATETQAGKSSG
jgi:hypothetical protein